MGVHGKWCEKKDMRAVCERPLEPGKASGLEGKTAGSQGSEAGRGKEKMG